MANIARLLKPQGPQYYMELDFVTTFASDHVPGWSDLPFALGSGRIVRPSMVDLKAMSSGKAPALEKQRLDQVGRAACSWLLVSSPLLPTFKFDAKHIYPLHFFKFPIHSCSRSWILLPTTSTRQHRVAQAARCSAYPSAPWQSSQCYS